MLRAALTVIARKGLDETRMVDIGDEAGMSAGHVMYYFPSKPGLLTQALNRSEDAFHEAARRAVAALPTARERLRRLVELSVPEDEHAVDPAPGNQPGLGVWPRPPHCITQQVPEGEPVSFQ